MNPSEEIEAQRKERQAKVNAAWASLAMSDSFRVVMEDAQLRFGMFKDSFLASDNYNPHAAAKRDGNKQVLAYFALRHARGVAFTEDETVGEKPTSAL